MTTTSKGYPYPIDTDSADVPSDVQALAEAVDAAPGVSSLTQTQIDALTAGQKWAGRIIWNQTTSKLQRSNGSAFTDIPTVADVAVLTSDTPQATGTAAVGTGATAARSDHVHALATSPALSGTPTAATAAADTNTTQLATTAFVIGQAGTANPPMDGTAATGTSLRYARQDHVHPSDNTKAPVASPTFTGTPAAPTAVVGTNTTQLATTAFVQAGIANDAVGKTLLDAKGDLIVATAADTPARLGVGTNNYILTADSTEATGMKWAEVNTGFSPFLLMGA